MTRQKPCRQRAFTLVELLVVIAIIGVMLAMLLPSLGAARDAARNSICVGNLRQMAIAQNNYAVDRKDYTFWTQMWNTDFIYFKNVPAGQNPTGCDGRPWLLTLMASPNIKVFYCPRSTLNPNDPIDGWNQSTAPDLTVVRLTYGLVSMREPTPYQLGQGTIYTNPMVYADLPAPTYVSPSTGNRPKKLSSIPAPDKIAVATDAQRAYYSAGVGFSYPGYTTTPWGQSVGDYVYPHRRQDNSWDGTTTSFFDGHAGYVKRENLGTLSGPPSSTAKYWISQGGAGVQMPMWW